MSKGDVKYDDGDDGGGLELFKSSAGLYSFILQLFYTYFVAT